MRVTIEEEFDINSLKCDLGLRPQIWEYPIEKRDEVRRTYIKVGPYQYVLSIYPKSRDNHFIVDGFCEKPYIHHQQHKQILHVLTNKVRNVICEEIVDSFISSECPYAYYVHCFAHRLQLTLVATFKEVIHVHHQFFIKLNAIVNIIGASFKHNDQVKIVHVANVAHLLQHDELESGSGRNQIGFLQRAYTCWSSHLKSISSLMIMFSATCEVLLNIIEDGTTIA
uniref:Zinc finger MYM-type protein 1-like n=1 Tax=Cajanus cajan TaxID=3821 RepID=A0A151TA44_CAJCA|nr:hypothetical protein KK1_018498 [Cajanus cajan]